MDIFHPTEPIDRVVDEATKKTIILLLRRAASYSKAASIKNNDADIISMIQYSFEANNEAIRISSLLHDEESRTKYITLALRLWTEGNQWDVSIDTKVADEILSNCIV